MLALEVALTCDHIANSDPSYMDILEAPLWTEPQLTRLRSDKKTKQNRRLEENKNAIVFCFCFFKWYLNFLGSIYFQIKPDSLNLKSASESPFSVVEEILFLSMSC